MATRSEISEFHAGQAAYHDGCAVQHGPLGETEAEALHVAAAKAHRLAQQNPLDRKLGGSALRASGFADAASQQAAKRRKR